MEKDISAIQSTFCKEKQSLIGARLRQALSDEKKESLLTAIWVGSILITLAVIYAVHLPSSLLDRLIDFFLGLNLVNVPGTGVPLPAPTDPAAHIELYTAGFQFAIAIGVIEIVILVIRILLHSPYARRAETIENIVFWLGAGYLISTYLLNITLTAEWFVFWAGIILVFGLALVARAFVLLVKR